MRQAFHGGEDLLAIALRHRSYGTVDRDAAAVAEQYIGGTLGEDATVYQKHRFLQNRKMKYRG